MAQQDRVKSLLDVAFCEEKQSLINEFIAANHVLWALQSCGCSWRATITENFLQRQTGESSPPPVRHVCEKKVVATQFPHSGLVQRPITEAIWTLPLTEWNINKGLLRLLRATRGQFDETGTR